MAMIVLVLRLTRMGLSRMGASWVRVTRRLTQMVQLNQRVSFSKKMRHGFSIIDAEFPNHCVQSTVLMATKNKKKAAMAVMIVGSIGVIAGASAIAAILAKKSLKLEEGKGADVKEDDQGGSVEDDDETKANAGDAIVTIESQPYTIEDVFLRTGNTFLTIWNTRVSCNATTAGDSETLSLTPSIDVDGAYYIKSM